MSPLSTVGQPDRVRTPLREPRGLSVSELRIAGNSHLTDVFDGLEDSLRVGYTIQCYSAAKCLFDHCGGLNIDPGCIAVGGASAGGGLAASLALLARDRREFALAFEMLIFPMLDDRNVIGSGSDVSDTMVWSREKNWLVWSAYLGHDPGLGDTSQYAAALRAIDLTGLPRTLIAVGGLDVFVDEDLAIAQCLVAAGVATGLHLYSGRYHGFCDIAPDAAISKRLLGDRDDALRQALSLAAAGSRLQEILAIKDELSASVEHGTELS